MSVNCFSYLCSSDSDIDEEKTQLQIEVKKEVKKETKKELKEGYKNKTKNLKVDDGWTLVGKKKNKKKDKYTNEPRKDVELWYNNNTWQYKLVNDLYVFKENGESVLEKYDILYLKKMYKNARNNYKRNKAVFKLLQVITKLEWSNIEGLVEEVDIQDLVSKVDEIKVKDLND